MGFFGTYLYDGTRRSWQPALPAINEVGQTVRGEQLPDLAEPWLLVDIHDSDITTVTYRPTGRGTGTAYLGITPRTYFNKEQASAPTDVASEASGLADWWLQVSDGGSEADREAKEIELRTYLAQDLDPNDVDLDDDEDPDDLDDGEIFVEVKTGRFLAALNLPLPVELAR
jgi:hypothetical protein